MIKNLHQKLVGREISDVDLVNNYFRIIQEKDSRIKAFLTLNKEEALAQAKSVDEKIEKGEEIGILTGIPFAVKDNILTKGIKTTAGSKILENYIASYNAFVIEQLQKEGAILLGKTNMDEFAMGSSTENSAFFPTKNPFDLERVPGGSSGGSAAAVASKMVPFALGSDTGGSVRQPASFCGVVGFKPTYGAVSRSGLIAMASSLDVIGPLALSVEDAEIIFRVISGRDVMDSTSFDLPSLEAKSKPIKDLVIGIPEGFFGEGVDPEVKENIEKVIEKIRKEGAKIETIKLANNFHALSCYYIIMPAEVSTNLARYDGVRYSPLKVDQEGQISSLHDLYFKTRGLGFGKEVRRRLILGTYVLSKGYYDAYYKKAQKVRRVLFQEWKKAFQKVDFIITPTTPTPAFKLGEKTKDPLAMYLSDVYTVGANIVGDPAISLKAGETRNNLPVGLQILGDHFSDYSLLNFAKKVEDLIKENG